MAGIAAAFALWGYMLQVGVYVKGDELAPSTASRLLGANSSMEIRQPAGC